MRFGQSDSDAIDATRNNRYSVAALLTLSLRMTVKPNEQNDKKTLLPVISTAQLTPARHFDRAKASGEIPKFYALTQGNFSTALEMTVNQGIKGAGMINAKSRGFKNGGGNFHKRILCLFIKTLDEDNI